MENQVIRLTHQTTKDELATAIRRVANRHRPLVALLQSEPDHPKAERLRAITFRMAGRCLALAWRYYELTRPKPLFRPGGWVSAEPPGLDAGEVIVPQWIKKRPSIFPLL